MPSIKSALDLLKETSRTFFIPISLLPPGLQEAVASAYLCMRAIDQIEDHPTLDGGIKISLLRQISLNLQAGTESSAVADFAAGLEDYSEQLEEVTLRIGEWALLAPDTIAPRIWDATAAMADRMAYWAEQNWQIKTEADLDRYTFSVAGAVGLMLSDLWAWYDGTETSRMEAIGFGRGLQSVNILRNHLEDKDRGVDFFPEGWTADDMQRYARRNLRMADAYTQALPKGPALLFCRIPLALATATIDALAQGREKLTRADVMAIVTPLLGVGKSIELMTKV
ncbi:MULTISPECIES: squalene/phytoene synthase family protein [Cyanophyceae]|uniref:Phytoene/squalene synthase family protein n=1 Tax=Leptolyngbya subtilissima DQ-A4 TaxID=2933933 RepID=A0ABV0K6J7_9CYAN|nr:phytoene/squalene synthase family protein [Nodosilinea sp. FACHB-141]MBD2113873.1 phytoene/squalene synthase family protein [Nodosilinea sp. FACHB-141]